MQVMCGERSTLPFRTMAGCLVSGGGGEARGGVTCAGCKSPVVFALFFIFSNLFIYLLIFFSSAGKKKIVVRPHD